MTSLPPITETKPNRSGSDTRQVLQRNVALYPIDIERVREIQRQYELDSFSKAVRKVIELATKEEGAA